MLSSCVSFAYVYVHICTFCDEYKQSWAGGGARVCACARSDIAEGLYRQTDAEERRGG